MLRLLSVWYICQITLLSSKHHFSTRPNHYPEMSWRNVDLGNRDHILKLTFSLTSKEKTEVKKQTKKKTLNVFLNDTLVFK